MKKSTGEDGSNLSCFFFFWILIFPLQYPYDSTGNPGKWITNKTR